VSTFPSLDISPAQREILDDALRVDQSGEITVNWMYRGQVTVLGRVGSLIQVSHLETAIQPLHRFNMAKEMQDQEKRYLEVLDKLQLQHQV
jgi:ubiquinone biosynthesis monooxygenase Coq7